MIEDNKLSKQLVEMAYELNGSVNEMLRLVSDNCTQKEYENYRRAAAHTISEIFERLIEPITAKHSDLDRLKEMGESTGGSREEDILYYDPEAPPMIERLYHVINDDGSKSGIVVHLRKPAKSKDADDWYCTWSCNSDNGRELKKSFGIDAVESFLNAVVMVDGEIRNIMGDRNIIWVGGNNVDLVPESK